MERLLIGKVKMEAHDARVCEMGDDAKARLCYRVVWSNLYPSRPWFSWGDCFRFSGLFPLAPQFLYLRGLYWGTDLQGLRQNNIAVPEQARDCFFVLWIVAVSILGSYKFPTDACYVPYGTL